MKNGFYAYPSFPADIGGCVTEAAKSATRMSTSIEIKAWEQLAIVGHFISDEVLGAIESADFFVADITSLNFNVTYEVGFAIGNNKRVLLTKNSSLDVGSVTIEDIGIFDTLGYQNYQNVGELRSFLLSAEKDNGLDISQPLNSSAPVYLLEAPLKLDWTGRVVSRIKKSGYIFRNFDPNEQPRLSAYEAINQVASSYGVVVTLLSKSNPGNEIHNLRAAFIAGLANGMNKPLRIIQNGDDPVPIDYRDFVSVTYHPNDINEVIAGFASEVAMAFQQTHDDRKAPERSFLKKLNMGATSAENEMRELYAYYLETDQYLKALRGEAHLVVGRKGSGKSAIFLQIRDRERERSRSKNIVLDLKPDGYKLIKFKEKMLSFLEEGSYQHTITAFWEYVLLLEICYKIIEKDKRRHITDHVLFDGYRRLSDLYDVGDYSSEGDFSERMSGLIENIYSEYEARHPGESNVRLSASDVTELLYRHDVRNLRDELISYMGNKGALWLLFDNIDNGWPTTGLAHEDLLIIRALIDATRKIERDFDRKDLEVYTSVFLRNDVYELLVRETADRGKEASVVLDWTDSDLLREMVRLRIVNNGLNPLTSFMDAWLAIFSSHFNGEETSEYLIGRSLMRPRFLLNLINHCKSFAVNLNHEIIEENDIEKGLQAYSSDLLRDIGYELHDVSEHAENILYSFVGASPEISIEEVVGLLSDAIGDKNTAEEVMGLLLWYGFLGVKVNSDDPKYIYDFNYNKALMDGVMAKSRDRTAIVINEAFWPALMVGE